MRFREISETVIKLSGFGGPKKGHLDLSGKNDMIDPNALSNFLDDWQNMTDPNPLDDRQRVFGNAVVTLTTWSGNITIKDIRSFAKGGGTEAMTALCQLADKYGVTLDLYAKGYAHVSTENLVPFYARFGFVRSSHGFDEEDDGVDMTRHPN
jgi:hypothetical protein